MIVNSDTGFKMCEEQTAKTENRRIYNVKYLLLVCIYTLPFFSYCQEISKEVKLGIIRGQVMQVSNKTDTFPIPDALVTWPANSETNDYTTRTSLNGEFTLIIPDSLIKRRLKIRVNCIGCTPKIVVVKKEQLPINNLRILMEPYVIYEDFE